MKYRLTNTHTTTQLLWGVWHNVNPVSISRGWDVHSQGLTELLRLRGSESFTTRRSRNLFWIIFNNLVSFWLLI